MNTALILLAVATIATSSFSERDKTGTNRIPRNTAGSQMPSIPAFASLEVFQAEGKGLEPSTPCGATDFESVSSPFGYPPEDVSTLSLGHFGGK